MAMFIGKENFSIPQQFLRYFVHNAKYGNWKIQDFQAPHNAGWGMIWRQDDQLKVIRKLQPLWNFKWESLSKIKSDFFAIHARWALPQSKIIEDVHPISLNGRNFLIHNGIISDRSFRDLILKKPKLNLSNIALDTRKYLAVLDQLKIGEMSDPSFRIHAIGNLVSHFNKDLSANAFYISQDSVDMISMHTQPIIQKYTYVLNHGKYKKFQYFSSFPYEKVTGIRDHRVPNRCGIHYDFTSQSFTTTSF